MIVHHFTCPAVSSDELISELHSQGTQGIVERESGADEIALQAFFDENQPLDLTAIAQWHTGQETAEDRDWVAGTEDSFQPLLIGERFYLVPDWNDTPTPPGRFRLPTHPGMACGTGYHEATQQSLEAMETLLQPGAVFVDIGVGAGLLCVAATMLGARLRVGVDNDEDSVFQARTNTLLDQAQVNLLVGTADAIASSSADLLVANISAPVNIALAPHYARILKSTGRAIIAGYEMYEEDAVSDALQAAGLQILTRDERNHWIAVTVGRAPQ